MTLQPKRSVSDLALFGGTPLFTEPKHVGQLYLPEWSRFESSFQGIFDRGYFTNHGPLVRQLEERLAGYLGVRHAVCMVNGTVALMVAAKALDLKGEVIVPAFTFIATAQALLWAGLDPVFCDVDPVTHTMTAERVAPLITDKTSAILGVHLWGRPCDVLPLESLARDRGLALFFDAAHAAGCSMGNRMIGGFGHMEIFSMHATKALSAGEGGFVTTDDDRLADRLRTVRNFHLSETFVKVPLRINAKMSEAQAALGLLGLESLPAISAANKVLYDAYVRCLSPLDGLSPLLFDEHEANNYQYMVVEVDKNLCGYTRDQVVRLLHAEGILARRYFTPGAHRIPPFCDRYPRFVEALPVTDGLSERLMQLPLGQGVSSGDVEKVGDLLSFLRERREILEGDSRLDGDVLSHPRGTE
ncbi:MAG: aminotransferase class I/II-fold pyridoxal phosphate-dependent enzyme [Nitrospinae bacterium]|nr:aminotransferase class I/II-fold pyridoxal phosphate-dependent enzyme [Nitrospinota bacterium]